MVVRFIIGQQITFAIFVLSFAFESWSLATRGNKKEVPVLVRGIQVVLMLIAWISNLTIYPCVDLR